MESKAKILGHPIHPILIVFPLGLLATAVIFDIVGLVSRDPRWAEFATYLTAAGVVGGLLAAIPGTIDWLAIPRGTRAKRVGLIHGVGNVIVVGTSCESYAVMCRICSVDTGIESYGTLPRRVSSNRRMNSAPLRYGKIRVS